MAPGDKDNLLASLKAAFDGIADAKLVENDAGLMHLPVEVVIDEREWEHVEIGLVQVSARP